MLRSWAGCWLAAALWTALALPAWGQDDSSGANDQVPVTPELEDGEAEEEGPFWVPPFSLDSRTMTGDWVGLRPAMSDLGIDWHLFWNQTFMSVMAGGDHTNSLKPDATYDILMTMDLGKMGVWKDAEVLVHARQQWGTSINPWAGTVEQVSDDNDGDRGIYVDQLWFRQHLLDRKLAWQFGYLDFQTIVDRNAYANTEDIEFMNAALDNNPIIPTASLAGLGTTLSIKPVNWYSLLLGAADAQRLPLYKPGFSTAFHDEAWFVFYMEHGLHPRFETARGPLTGNYRVGMVYEPNPRVIFEDPQRPADRRGDDVGLYLSFDQMVYREGPDDDQGLGIFFRYAWRHDEVYRFNQFYSGGLAYTGLIPTRDKDVLGLAFAQLVDSNEYRRYRDPDSGNETIYELYYAIELTPWLVITPDIQYIDNPGADDSISHTITGGIRVRVSL